ncbi:two-component system, chemotaxis family, response regulator CheB [Lachnospiraceae bacterium KH1T2]|jgi:two-component system chemotaxis response regulator CheB|nr:two-component system, chemotaxis family, response regulator CheB [Lachnospiraceae bacterium KH1T2]
MKKRILVVDDSALMRRVCSDIINADSRYYVEDTAKNGLEALELIKRKKFDAVILDVNMPKMNGLELLRELEKQNIKVRVMMFSSTTSQGAKETIEALELGAIDFVRKPDGLAEVKGDEFRNRFLQILANVSGASLTSEAPKERSGIRAGSNKDSARTTSESIPRQTSRFAARSSDTSALTRKREETVKTGDDKNSDEESRTFGRGSFTVRQPINKEIVLRPKQAKITGDKIVALASSTGGPRALQQVIPFLPENLDAAVLLVQHMPKGFTKSLAERLDALSKMRVVEASEGEKVEKGTVYIAMGGRHMTAVKDGNGMKIKYTDLPMREGVRPSANYMYESLMDSPYAEICCVVLTGMGADGTAGIRNLETKKRIYVIAQDEPTSAVYGMPKAVAQAGLVSEILPLEKIADAVTRDVGVR